ncbi:MAG TPA: hypothetical protein VMH35_07480 [Streptosporangiaceae bacterium]|nr:hypothetical protein [Streptosporangiaceae bacterium]
MESMTRTEGRPGLVGRVSAASPLAAIRDELQEARAARAERKALEHDLASYTTPSDLNDLGAILDRHSAEETADIRRILAARRTA